MNGEWFAFQAWYCGKYGPHSVSGKDWVATFTPVQALRDWREGRR